MSAISLGVDVGSTSIKVIALDAETKRVERVVTRALDSRIHGTPAGHYEEDPRHIRDLTYELIRELSTEYGERIEAIGFTGQMHSGMFVTAALEPITNLVTWQDKRGDEIAPNGRSSVERLRDAAGSDPTGVGIHTGFLATTALWFAEHSVKLPAGAKLIGIYDWLASMLVGRAVTDITSAAAWGLYDIVRKEWKHSVVEAAQIDAGALPEVVEPGEMLGMINVTHASALGLRTATRIHASIGDTQASYLGSGVRATEILLNFGTGSQSMWETEQPVATHGTDIRYLRGGRYIATAPTLAGGKAYQLLAEFYASVLCAFGHEPPARDDLYAILNELAMNSGSEGITFDPIFAGSRWKDLAERASIVGLDAANFRIGPVTRALLEGMIDEVAQPYFLREGRVKHEGLVGAGNGMRRNPALRDAAEQRFGLTIRLAESDEEAARGAALLTI
jgi:sedoheptulokinase